MGNLVANQSNVSIFGPPELSVESKNYATKHRPQCGNVLVSGSFYSVAVLPQHGTRVIDSTSNSEYWLFRLSGTPFSSSMAGASVRLRNLYIDSLSYVGVDGKTTSFSGTPNTDFVAKIESVSNSNSLKLDRPLIVPNISLNDNMENEDSPYFENNESYFVSNIGSGSFEIVHSPRISTADLQNYTKIFPTISLTFSNLAFTAKPKTYRIMKKSLNTPETPTCIAQGNVIPHELLMTFNANIDYRNGGIFYSQAHADTYWFSSPPATFTHSPAVLIDSITINSSGGANTSENEYLIFKENTGEASRDYQYVTTTYLTSSAWYTTPKLFPNFDVEPDTYYSCSVDNGVLSEYTISIEVVNNGSSLNSNPIKLIKNTAYEFSVTVSNLKESGADYCLLAYFSTTSTTGAQQKFLIGTIDSDFYTTYTAVYRHKFVANKTMFGTIIFVPKYINTVAISNVSLKPYQDDNYALDSFVIDIPYTPVLKNEKVELEAEIFDESGLLCSRVLKTYLHVDPQGHSEVLVGSSAVLGGIVLDGGGP